MSSDSIAQAKVETTEWQAGLPAVPGFQLEAMLGTGGMSVVVKSVQLSLNRVVALKFLHRHMLSDLTQIQRFQQEAKVASLLEHANIGRVFAFGIAEGQPYLVMEYYDGEPLSARIQKLGSLDWEAAKPLFLQICQALAHAHAAGVVHRDLKPSNVFIAKEANGETAKVLDFGIAKLLGDSSLQKLTTTGVVLGSPQYMSPEHCLGEGVDSRTDIYSLGCLVFEVLTGRTPFDGDTPLEVATKQLHAEPPPLSEVANRPFSDDLENLVRKLLAKDSSQRFQTASEVLDAINGADPHGPITHQASKRAKAGTDGPSVRKLTKPVRNRILVLFAAIAVSWAGAWFFGNFEDHIYDKRFAEAEQFIRFTDPRMALSALTKLESLCSRPAHFARLGDDYLQLAQIGAVTSQKAIEKAALLQPAAPLQAAQLYLFAADYLSAGPAQEIISRVKAIQTKLPALDKLKIEAGIKRFEGFKLEQGGDWASARTSFEQARQISVQTGDPALHVHACTALLASQFATCATTQEKKFVSGPLVNEALSAAKHSDDPRVARELLELANTLSNANLDTEYRACVQEIGRIYHDDGHSPDASTVDLPIYARQYYDDVVSIASKDKQKALLELNRRKAMQLRHQIHTTDLTDKNRLLYGEN